MAKIAHGMRSAHNKVTYLKVDLHWTMDLRKLQDSKNSFMDLVFGLKTGLKLEVWFCVLGGLFP